MSCEGVENLYKLGKVELGRAIRYHSQIAKLGSERLDVAADPENIRYHIERVIDLSEVGIVRFGQSFPSDVMREGQNE